jgi:hypothetical protein
MNLDLTDEEHAALLRRSMKTASPVRNGSIRSK